MVGIRGGGTIGRKVGVLMKIMQDVKEKLMKRMKMV
jgi:hypothetical protein